MPKKIKTLSDFSGGLNLYDSPTALDDNECALMNNVTGDREGVLRMGSSNIVHPDLGDQLVGAVFNPSANLHMMHSDFSTRGEWTNSNAQPPFHIITGDESHFVSMTNWSVSQANTTINLTAGTGIDYEAGASSGGHTDAFVKFTCQGTRKIYPNKWYAFYMQLYNSNHGAQAVQDGHLELLLGKTASAGNGNQMRPAKYKRDYDGLTTHGGRGGIYIKPHQANVSSAFSRVTSSTTDEYTVVASGICQAPAGVSKTGGDVYIYGHLGGADTTPTSRWHMTRFCLMELPSTLDNGTDGANSNSIGEVIFTSGNQIIRWDGSVFTGMGFTDLKTFDDSYSDSSIVSGGTSSAVKTVAYQGDNLFRLCEQDFEVLHDNWIIGPVNGTTNDSYQDDLTVHTSNTGTVCNTSYCPEARNYLSKAQDPNGAFIRKTWLADGTRNLFPLILSDAAGTGSGVADDYNAMYELCHHGSVALQVVQGGASDEEGIDDNWKKTWVFGISYKLRDNTFTNVKQAYTHEHASGTDKIWHGRIIDGGKHTNNTDGVLTGKTVTFASSTAVTDAILYVKNK